MADKLPYVPNYGVITKVLEKIKSAATPERFTQDFLATKLGMKGGSNRPVIPFLKRIGFIGTDGAPTEIYKRFRNATNSGAAVAEALRACNKTQSALVWGLVNTTRLIVTYLSGTRGYAQSVALTIEVSQERVWRKLLVCEMLPTTPRSPACPLDTWSAV